MIVQIPLNCYKNVTVHSQPVNAALPVTKNACGEGQLELPCLRLCSVADQRGHLLRMDSKPKISTKNLKIRDRMCEVTCEERKSRVFGK